LPITAGQATVATIVVRLVVPARARNLPAPAPIGAITISAAVTCRNPLLSGHFDSFAARGQRRVGHSVPHWL